MLKFIQCKYKMKSLCSCCRLTAISQKCKYYPYCYSCFLLYDLEITHIHKQLKRNYKLVYVSKDTYYLEYKHRTIIIDLGSKKSYDNYDPTNQVTVIRFIPKSFFDNEKSLRYISDEDIYAKLKPILDDSIAHIPAELFKEIKISFDQRQK